MDDRGLLQLISDERDPQMRKVLEGYRAAEIELNSASELLQRMGRDRWAAAAASRARDVAWQAQRYMRLERERSVKLQDFMDDADTDPIGYPKHTGLSDPLQREEPSEAMALDSEPAPPLSRADRILQWSLVAGLSIVVIVTLWLMHHYAVTVD